ncbi:glucose-6-phosphate 1-epimerase [[Candida] anglica]
MSIEETENEVILTHKNGSVVKILKYGATVTSWTTSDGKEQLWLSSAAKLDGSKPVRGGIPLVFPIFGKCQDETHPTFKLPQHGFARNSVWEFLGQTAANPLTVEFALSPEQVSNDLTNLWGDGQNDFTLIYTIQLNESSLKTQIEVENAGKREFEFKWLFHTYFAVPDITDVLVTNFTDAKCYDQLLAEEYSEKAPMISFHEEFDRIYKGVDQDKVAQIVELGKVLHNVKRTNLPDCVVWNPWIKKSAGMADFAPKDGYKNMLCIEPGHVDSFIKLSGGEKWTAAQELSIGGDIKVQTNIY